MLALMKYFTFFVPPEMLRLDCVCMVDFFIT